VAFSLLIGTIQLAARLQRTALVSAAATDAAEHVAHGADRSTAEASVRRLVGGAATIRWSTSHEGVRVDLVVASPTVPGLSTRIHRGANARWERMG
jgi:hypothetical protein